MNVIDLLTGSGLLGGVMGIITRWNDYAVKSRELKLEIEKLKAQTDAGVRISEAEAFKQSLTGANEDLQISDKASLWVINAGELVDCFRSFTRPGLTWLLCAVVLIVFFQVPEAKQVEMTDQLVFGAFTALFWWFGSRYPKP